MGRRLSIVGLVASICLMAGGLLWSVVAKPEMVWSPQQAAEYRAANDALHAASAEHGHDEHRPHAISPTEISAAKERFKQIDQQLQSARFAEQSLGKWLAAAGLALAVVFGLGYGACRGDQE